MSTKKTTKGSKKKSKTKAKANKKCCEGEKLCANMAIEEKIRILVAHGILQDIDQCEPIEFEEFIGDVNYIGSLQESIDPMQFQPEPSLAHARQFCIEFGVLPLGCSALRKTMKVFPGILLYGPSGSGKTFLSQAIAHTTSSRWFDLSPKNVLCDENILEMTIKELSKLIHLTFELADYFQPSVVYIDQIEKIFITSKKRAVIDAARMKKDLLSHCLKINKDRRILIVGNSSEPFNSSVDMNEMKKFFYDSTNNLQIPLMCYIPYPSYSNRMRLWQHFIQELGTVSIEELNESSKFELSILTLLSEGYTGGSIEQTCKLVLTKRRFDKYYREHQVFTTQEFLRALSKTIYTYKDDQESFRKYTAIVTGRSKAIQIYNSKLAAEAAGDGTDGKKGSKKKGGKKRK